MESHELRAIFSFPASRLKGDFAPEEHAEMQQVLARLSIVEPLAYCMLHTLLWGRLDHA